HCRIDCSQTFRPLQVIQHPLRSAVYGSAPGWFPGETIIKFQDAVQREESVSPVDSRLELESGGLPRWVTEQLIQPRGRGNRPAWLMRVKDRQGDDDRARPRRHFVDVDVSPIGQQ